MIYVRGCSDEEGIWKRVGWEAWNMHQPNASAYYVDSGTALKSVSSKLQLHVFCEFVINSHKTWKLATEKIHFDLDNLTHFHNSYGDKLDHTVYWEQLRKMYPGAQNINQILNIK